MKQVLHIYYCIISVLLALLVVNTYGCGFGTHNMVGHRAFQIFNWTATPELSIIQKYIIANKGAFQAGTTFPDWGYACKDYGDESEAAHWPPFMRAASAYLARKYGTDPARWNNDGQKLAVFLVGMTSHMIADVSWHSIANFEEGFIDAMANLDFFGHFNGDAYQTAHTLADVGGDVVMMKQFNTDWLTSEWYVPVSDLTSIYHGLGYNKVTYFGLMECMSEMYVALTAMKDAGELAFDYYAYRSPFLVEQYNHYFFGGMDDMAAWTAECWPSVIQWFTNPDARDPICMMAGSFPDSEESEGGGTFEDTMALDTPHEWQNKFIGLQANGKRLPSQGTKAAHGSVPEVVSTIMPGTVKDLKARMHIQTADDHAGVFLQMKPPTKEIITPAEAKEKVHIGASRVITESHTIFAPSQFSYLGTSLIDADVDGDGYDDLIVGAPGWGPVGEAGRGAVYVLLGGPDFVNKWPQAMNLDQFADVIVHGDEPHSRFGWSVAVLDFNADGVKDLVVGAPSSGSMQTNYYGAVYVYFGRTAKGVRWTVSPTPSIIIDGNMYHGNFGYTLATGDIDGDGVDDLAASSPYELGRQGSVSLYVSGTHRNSGPYVPDLVLNGTLGSEEFGLSLSFVSLDEHEISLHPGFNLGGNVAKTLLLVGSPTYSNYSQIVSNNNQYTYPASNIGKVTVFAMGSRPKSTPESPDLIAQALLTVGGASSFDRLGAHFTAGTPSQGFPSLAVSLPTTAQKGENGVGAVVVFPITDFFSSVLLDDPLPAAPKITKAMGLGSLPVNTQFGGSQFMQHFGLQSQFVKLHKDNTTNSNLDSLFVSSPWGSSDIVYMWRGGNTFPRGDSTTTTADVAYTRSNVSKNSKGIMFGARFAFPDLDGDGVREVVVASTRDSTFAELGGSLNLFLSNAL
eukprot:TRINITY_DN1320_c0_g1_i1.p1 TRINITY_DN1320_c0_g1~~TRINITY_DN1320_c0_g1_i1.p1  ORF type:complete len:907 (+),score=269.70 TRINITY_DN1320_c0_g1_i1:97-2817(+)